MMSKPLSDVTREYGNINDPSTPLLTQRKPRKRSRTTIGVFICLVILVLFIGLGIGGYFFHEHFYNDNEGHCNIQGACNSKVLAYIDDSADPCEDFFQYSCGKWLSSNPLDGRDEWGTFYALAYDNWHHLNRYLTRSISGNDSDAIRKSKYIFSACTNSEFIKDNLLNHLQSFMRSAGGWMDLGIYPEDEWDFDNLVEDHYLGSPAYFAFDVEPDDFNSSKPVIKVVTTVLTIPILKAFVAMTTLHKHSVLGQANLIICFSSLPAAQHVCCSSETVSISF